MKSRLKRYTIRYLVLIAVLVVVLIVVLEEPLQICWGFHFHVRRHMCKC